MKKYAAYGIGAALVDTEIKVEDSELAAMNVEKGMMTLVDADRQSELLGHLEGHLVKASHASGGSAGNSMIATAQFGKPTFMSCKVANDADGDIYIADLEAAGVDHALTGEREEGITGKCLVLISPDAERSMNTNLSISETLSTDQLNAQAIGESEYYYMEGYVVTSPTGRAAAVRGREIAEAAGVKTSISLSDPGMVEFFRDGLQEMIGERVNLIFCNEAEALGWGNTDNIEVAIEKLKQVADTFVITRGAEGALTYDGDNLAEIPPHKVHAVDSNGAGDMFAGAFLYAITRGEDFPTAGRFASLAAGKIVANYGPRLKPEEYPALRNEFFGG
ncbi:adenosine kinase [Halioglobus japonicus]|uniref:Adenosine kinase n=1 Tax=Halioglobus japonicus TaxID=930805 RepID=A0AAP8MBT3_9GAMM|nr:adenosine kinase [Halioglobus japonicus]AQA17007.1 adenosine kinase [Halioglobus japonicus]PLW84911.1 adenosine kinase [Halioglobus japonicus]GHD18475.1 adenosine kinase [Halioglobus japonicus]